MSCSHNFYSTVDKRAAVVNLYHTVTMSQVQLLPIFEQSHKSNAKVDIVGFVNDGDEVPTKPNLMTTDLPGQMESDQPARLNDGLGSSKTPSRIDSPL